MPVCLITGSGSGNGRGMAVALARRGYDIAIHHSGRDPESAETVRKEIIACGRHCEVFTVDLRNECAASELLSEFKTKFDRLDLFINNAGITRFAKLEEMSEALFDEVQKINWHAAVFCVREAGKFMAECGISGSIVIIASNHHIRNWPNAFAYGSMKEALRRFTEYAALDFARYGIRVNCIAPGYIDREYDDTEQTKSFFSRISGGIPLHRVVLSTELASIADFLASSAAASITGVTIDVDGGDRLLNDAPESYGIR